jgi:hypothetical protein
MQEENPRNLPETNSLTKKQTVLEFIWGQYRQWDQTAVVNQKKLKNYRTLMVFLIIATAFFGILSGQYGGNQRQYEMIVNLFQWITIICASLSAFIGSRILTENLEKSQIKARAAAEAIKSEAYKYLLNVGNYNMEPESKIFDRIRDISLNLSEITPINLTKESELKGIPNFDFNLERYISERIKGQIYRYYQPKADSYNKKVKFLNFLTNGLAIAGAIVSSISAINNYKSWSVWIAFFTTASAALTSYLTSNRFSFLASSYTHTANSLRMELARWNTVNQDDPKEMSHFVLRCEAELSRENQAWVLEHSKKESDKNPSAPQFTQKPDKEEAVG